MDSFENWLFEVNDRCYRKAKSVYKVFPSAYASGAIVRCRKGKIWKESKFNLENERGLHGWFSRNHGKGWIDCKASTKDKKVPCGRDKAGLGREYPACRPTFSACNKLGVKRKKGSKRVSWD